MFRSSRPPRHAKPFPLAVLFLLPLLLGFLSHRKILPAASDLTGIHLVYHGSPRFIHSDAKNVGSLLTELQLEITQEDVLSLPPDEPLRDGMRLTIDRYHEEAQRYRIALPYDTLYCSDSTLPEGAEEILAPGQEGELLRESWVTFRNGLETERTILSERILTPPISRIVARGTSADIDLSRPMIRDGFIFLPSGEVLTFTGSATVRATAYTHTDDGCDTITATGSRVHWGTVAVDPRYIPYGTRMFITAADGSYIYGIAQAEDCGGAIKGDRMDLYLPTFDECMEFGRRVCTVYFLG